MKTEGIRKEGGIGKKMLEIEVERRRKGEDRRMKSKK